MLYCWDLANMGLWDTRRCCQSCHRDNEEYGYSMPYIEAGKTYIECCCAVKAEEGKEDAIIQAVRGKEE
jgi:hypothetical protein